MLLGFIVTVKAKLMQAYMRRFTVASKGIFFHEILKSTVATFFKFWWWWRWMVAQVDDGVGWWWWMLVDVALVVDGGL